MSLEENKAIVRRFFEAYAANDPDAIKELVAPDVVAHMPGSAKPVGRQTMLQGISAFNAAFSDRHLTIDDLIAEGDRVATRTTMRATHTDDYHGHPATGKQVEIGGLTIERIEDGRIVQRWLKYDQMELLQQLGLASPAG